MLEQEVTLRWMRTWACERRSPTAGLVPTLQLQPWWTVIALPIKSQGLPRRLPLPWVMVGLQKEKSLRCQEVSMWRMN